MGTQIVRPDRTKLFGVTHSMDGTPLRRQTRSLKIGIGLIKGKDLNCWINADGLWVIEIGAYGKDGKRIKGGERTTFTNRREAEAAYTQLWTKAPERKYPGKLPFFTFLHPNADGTGFLHDLEAIEAHGPMPTELDIFFTVDTPFVASYEWWSKSKLNCWGDGQNALRRIELARTAEEKELALSPIDTNYFPILGGCADGGCPHCIEHEEGKPKDCRPHGRLICQLSNSPSLGSSCTFDTTGFRSTQQLGSSLTDILEATGQGDPTKGRLAGIPLKLILRPYVAYPNGKSTTLYAVNVEFKPKTKKDAEQITHAMLRYANAYRAIPQLMAPVIEQLQLEAPTAGWSEEDESDEAEIMEAEFYPDNARKEGSPEAAAEVIEARKEELRARGAKVTEIPPRAAEQKPVNKMPVSLEMAKEFKKIKTHLNKETGNDELYYRVLNGAGYKKSNEVPTVDEGKRVYKLLLAEYRAVLAAKPASEPTLDSEQSDAAEPEVASTLDQSELDAREEWLPQNLQANPDPATEPVHFAALRELEIHMKARRKGGQYRDILGAHGAERTEDVTAMMYPAIKLALDSVIASTPIQAAQGERIKL